VDPPLNIVVDPTDPALPWPLPMARRLSAAAPALSALSRSGQLLQGWQRRWRGWAGLLGGNLRTVGRLEQEEHGGTGKSGSWGSTASSSSGKEPAATAAGGQPASDSAAGAHELLVALQPPSAGLSLGQAGAAQLRRGHVAGIEELVDGCRGLLALNLTTLTHTVQASARLS
jgi:hypothetical protein